MKRCLTVAFLALSCMPCRGQDAESIIEKYLATVGGKEAIATLISAQKKFLTISLTGRKDTALIVSAERLASFQHTETYYSQEKTLNHELYLNGRNATNIFYSPVHMVLRDSLKKREVVLSVHSTIYRSFEKKKLKLLKNRVIGNDTCYSIKNKIPSASNIITTYYIDQNTFLLRASSTDLTENNITYYKSYREVDGILFPFQEDYYLNNSLISRTIYESVSFNHLPEDYSFKPANAGGKIQRDTTSVFNRIEFTDATLNDKKLDQFISQFKGKPVLIDLWATWCPACKMEFNHYNDEFYSFLQSNKVEMVFLSIDDEKKKKAWEQDIHWYNINGYHALAGKNLVASIRKNIYHDLLMYIPRYILVNENGMIVSTDLGKPSSKNFRADLVRLLKP